MMKYLPWILLIALLLILGVVWYISQLTMM